MFIDDGSGLVRKRLRALQVKVRPPPYLGTSTSLFTSPLATHSLQPILFIRLPFSGSSSVSANMKPVVSALNAWSWYALPTHLRQSTPIVLTSHPPNSVIISIFAIVILSVLGSLYSVRRSDPLGHQPAQRPGPHKAYVI